MERLTHFLLKENTNGLYKREAISSISLTKDVANKLNEMIDFINKMNIDNLSKEQEQDGRINKAVVYLKDNLINTVYDLFEVLRKDGTIDNLVVDASLKELKELNNKFNYTSIAEHGAVKNNDVTTILKNLLLEPTTIDLNNESFYVSDTLSLENSKIQNGTLIFDTTKNCLHLLGGASLENVTIKIKNKGYANHVILLDYTKETDQWIKNNITLRNIVIDNSVESEFVNTSCAIKIIYDKYKIITNQIIDNLYFYGYVNTGILIEPQLRNEDDNPVFNSSCFTNIFFYSANTLLKTLPKIASGSVENAKGEIRLNLVNVSNQYKKGVNYYFMDLHNTYIDGVGVNQWDYYGNNIPSVGMYNMHKSKIFYSKDYMTVPTGDNENVHFGYRRLSTGEIYTNVHAVQPKTINNDVPERSSGTAWSVDNIKAVIFKPELNNPYNNEFIGFELQHNNKDVSDNKAIQIGFGSSGNLVWRQYTKSGGWSDIQQIYGVGKIPQSYSGKRPDGIGVGDMKFDTTVKKPVWWNGSKWITADGTAI